MTNTPSPTDELIEWVTQTLADARAGQFDLRDLGQAMNGKWDQDFPFFVLTRLESLLSDRAKLEEPTPEMVETFFTNLPSPYEIDIWDEEAAKTCIRAVFNALNRSTDRAT